MDGVLVKFIGGLVLVGLVIGLAVGLLVGRSSIDLCPGALSERECPSVLKPAGGAAVEESGEVEQFYRGAYAQCVLLASLSAGGRYTRQEIVSDCLDLTVKFFQTDIYSKDVEGWDFERVAVLEKAAADQ